MQHAVLDIGSNSVKLLVFHADPEGRPRAIYSRAIISRLSEGLNHSGQLAETPMRRTLDALATLLRESQTSANDVLAVITAPGRRASNAGVFLARLEAELGIQAQVLPGEREAELSLLATRRSFPDVEPLLMVDIGGASTEIVLVKEGQVAYLTSLDTGVVRLTEAFLRSDPISDEHLANARHAARGQFEAAVGEVLTRSGAPVTPVLVSGTATALAKLLAHDRYPGSERVHGTPITRAALDPLTDELVGMTVAQRKVLPALDPARADIIVAGCILVQSLLGALGLEQALVSSHGVRWGLAWELLEANR